MADSSQPSSRGTSRSRSRAASAGRGLHRLYSGQHIDDSSVYHERRHSGDDGEQEEQPQEETENSPRESVESWPHDPDGLEKAESSDLAEIQGGKQEIGDEEKNSPGELQRSDTQKTQKDPHLVTWEGPDDPANPKNWSMKRKWAATVIVSCFTLISPISSSMVAPALRTIAKDLNIDNDVELQMTLSIFVLAYAVGPLFFGPLSELYGRVPVLQLANLFYFCWNLGCGFAQTKGQMLAFRFLAGLGGSAPLACGGGVLSDCWESEQRGKAMSIYSLAPLLGPAIGPIAGGFITENTTWRWAFYATCIATIFVQILGVFFLQETYAPKLLHQKFVRLQKETGNELLRTESRLEGQTVLSKLRVALVRPFRLLFTQPIVQVIAVYLSFVYGVIYLVLSTFPVLWSDKYHESIGIGGLNYISLGLGFFLGAQVTAVFNDATYRKLKKRNNGIGAPEFRCPVIIPGAILIPVGLLWYGWSAQAQIHWIMPNIGACIFAAGTITIFQGTQTYVVDAYTRYAASGIAAVTVLRSLAGFGFPLFAPYLYNALDFGWGNTLLGILSAVIGIPAPLLLWKYGAKLRTMSPFAAG